MSDEINGSDRPLMPGHIGIRITVIDYDGATGTYRTIKEMSFTPPARHLALPGLTTLQLGRGRQERQDTDGEL
ncbi:hypothetical protein [Catenulispora subtropica]|uniref:Uncharacterized protein n=1 Tax=Catenulispora subtropica TaxID=450798 RepID=A0ABN2R2Y2_9ACTN